MTSLTIDGDTIASPDGSQLCYRVALMEFASMETLVAADGGDDFGVGGGKPEGRINVARTPNEELDGVGSFEPTGHELCARLSKRGARHGTLTFTIDPHRNAAGVEWSRIAGMRDVLAHDYFGVSLEVVWDAVQRNIPELEQTLEDFRNSLSNE